MSRKSQTPIKRTVKDRIYEQIDILLTQLESVGEEDHVTLKERVAALMAITRIEQIFNPTKKEIEDERAGSTVKQYATAFAQDATRRRKAGARSGTDGANEPEPDDWFEHAEREADADAAE